MLTDSHYTPRHVAWRLTEGLEARSGEAGTVADLCSGSGELLRSAERRLGRSWRFIARDIDHSAIALVRRRHPGWDAGVLDFRSLASEKVREPLRYNILLLNPPFSYRGKGGFYLTQDGLVGRFSPAIWFLCVALRFLALGGECRAILPENCLRSEKDSAAVQHITCSWDLTVLDRLARGTFPGVSVRTVMISLVRSLDEHRTRSVAESRRLEGCDVPTLSVVRGSVQCRLLVSSVDAPVAFVHTTSLRNGKVYPERVSYAGRPGRWVSGPFVALPRVGALKHEKIAIFLGRERVLLSDCVYAISVSSFDDAVALRARILNDFLRLVEYYQGSCAPYLTKENLRLFLGGIGYRVVFVDGGAF